MIIACDGCVVTVWRLGHIVERECVVEKIHHHWSIIKSKYGAKKIIISYHVKKN